MKRNIKTISESLLEKPSNTSRVFTTKCILLSFGFAFGSCLLFGIVLFLYNNTLQSKNVDAEKNSAITGDPGLNTKYNSGNGSKVDMVNINGGKISLNASDDDLSSDNRPTVVRSSGKFEICKKKITERFFLVKKLSIFQ